MSRLLLSTFLVAATASVGAASQDLFLGSSNTSFVRADLETGDIDGLGACGGQIQSMGEDFGDVWLGDLLGRIYHYEPGGFPGYAFDAPNDATALVVRGGALWIGGSDGTVHEVDKRDGTLLRTFDAGVPIGALLVHDGFLYAGSTFGIVKRMDVDDDELQFWGTCGGPVNALAADDTHLIVADTSGTVYRIGFASQSIESSFTLESDSTAIALHGGELLVAGTSGDVLRVDPHSGALLGSFFATSGLEAMALAAPAEPGAPYCYGISCPCGNDDVMGGCGNHLGHGASTHGSGTASVGADDLVMATTGLPQGAWGVPYMSSQQGEMPFGDGLLCTGAGYPVFRFPARNAGTARTITLGPGIADHSQRHFGSGAIAPGNTWVFQVWYRNPHGPCGNGFNTSNAYVVSFEL